MNDTLDLGQTLSLAQKTTTELLHPDAVFQVNNSTGRNEPYWQTLTAVQIGCDVDSADDYDCDGGCIVTLHVVPGWEDGSPDRWHLTAAQARRAQFRRVA